jgi:hypothetical protein
MRALSEAEVAAVAGGVRLENYRTSDNVDEQYWQQEGNMWVLYTRSGRCLAAQFENPFA